MVRSISKSFELEIERLKNKLLSPLIAFGCMGILSHIHTCILQGLRPIEVLPDTMYSVYIERLTDIVSAFIAGPLVERGSEPVELLNLAIASERLLLLAVVGLWLVYHALLLLEQTVKIELIKEDVLLYMDQRKVSHKTQVQVLNQLNEASKLDNVKRSYESWLASGIPVELERLICQELWFPRLQTLGLIDYVFGLLPELKTELVLIVREEILAKHNILFKEGDVPFAAYLVLKGVIHASSYLRDVLAPYFTTDMWVGEKALVSSDRVRTITCLCKTTCMLMKVPANDFRNVLLEYGILGQFEEYCVENLWKGICGRCGTVGDHFANECPLSFEAGYQEVYTLDDTLFDDDDNGEDYMAPTHSEVARRVTVREERLLNDSPIPQERLVKPDLKELLRRLKLKHLAPIFQICGVWGLDDLCDLDPETLERMVEQSKQTYPGLDADVLREQLSQRSALEFKDSLEERAKKVLGTTEQRSQHLIFLSHHKADGGTEASLLRQELELQIKDDISLWIMEAPIFLDSEDLTSLEKLTDHVSNSHNVVLLLTKDVLTRPWILVELATALKFEVPIVPVEIKKPGHSFNFPDAAFYEKMRRGKLLSSGSMAVLQQCHVTLADVERSLRHLFNTISLTYSPHRPALHRKVEVSDILKKCNHRQGLSTKRRTTMRGFDRMTRSTSSFGRAASK